MEQDYCEDSGTRKAEDYTRGGDSETEDAKHTSLEEQLSSLVNDTFLQLEQLILDFRELLCVCQPLYSALNMEMRS